MKIRDYKLDFLRVISMFMVVIIHVANCYCREFGNITDISFIGGVVFNVISRISVPIFLMISGALFADRPFNKQSYKKRIIRFVIIIIFWDILYLIWEYLFLGIKYNKLYRLLFEPYRRHLWFLHTIILIYIIQPLLNIFIRKTNNIVKNIAFVFWLLICTISLINTKTSDILSPVCYAGYFVLGNIIYKDFKYQKFKKYNLLFAIISILCFIVDIFLSYKLSIMNNEYKNYYFAYRNPLIMIPSVLLFMFILNNYKLRKEKLLLNLSACSFGIYLIHGVFLDIIKEVFNLYSINSFIGIPIFSIMIFILSYFSILLIKKIKLSKYIM